jgi:hypothetical protein
MMEKKKKNPSVNLVSIIETLETNMTCYNILLETKLTEFIYFKIIYYVGIL